MIRNSKLTIVVAIIANLVISTPLCSVVSATETPMSSDNVGRQNHNTYSTPIRSHIISNSNGTISRVEYIDGAGLLIEDYSKDFLLIGSRVISIELPIYGGFYAGRDYNFIVSGQKNEEENNNKEVIRVIKYSKEWKRLASTSITAEAIFTTVPFELGSLSMVQDGTELFIHTARKRYTSSDGLNHQSNLTLKIDISTMTVNDYFTKDWHPDGPFPVNHVSHSFAQFVDLDSENIFFVDIGDGYPRAVVLNAINKGNIYGSSPKRYEVLEIAGQTGNNMTGVSVGGLVDTDNNVLVAGNSCRQEDEAFYWDGIPALDNRYSVRNAFVGIVSKDGKSKRVGNNLVWLTDYEFDGALSASTPHIVPLGDGRLMVLWQKLERYATTKIVESTHSSKTLAYVLLDDNGKLLTPVKETTGTLSDCPPITLDGKVTWYVTNNAAPTFYQIDPATMELTQPNAVAVSGKSSETKATYKMDTTSIISTGFNHSAAIKSDGSLWTWGWNAYGQLGDGTTTERHAALKIMDSASAIYAGHNYTMAIKADGSLWGWGKNENGQLGDGTTEDRCIPVKIMDNVVSVSPSDDRTLALKNDGSLWGWGWDFPSKPGSITANPIPTKITDSVISVSNGSGYYMIIKDDNSLLAWGSNTYGNIGNGLADGHNVFKPIKVMDDVAFVSAAKFGGGHTMAIKTDGSLWAWGCNSSGQIGDGTKDNRPTPVKIMDSVTSVCAGANHTIALKSDGSLWAWGSNKWGELGTPLRSEYLLPAKVLDSVSAISTYHVHSIATKTDGSLWAWGDNLCGQLGNGTVEASVSPLKIP